MTNVKWYLAGPMRGYEKYNFPAFEAAAKHLRELGYDIVSPHELDSKEIREEALRSETGLIGESGKIGGETAGEILARDVRILIDDLNGIIFLPGWERSTGARLEAFVGLLHNYPFFEYRANEEEAFLEELPQQVVAGVCVGQWVDKSTLQKLGLVA